MCLLWLQSIYSVYEPQFIQPFICLLMNIWFILLFCLLFSYKQFCFKRLVKYMLYTHAFVSLR